MWVIERKQETKQEEKTAAQQNVLFQQRQEMTSELQGQMRNQP